VPSKPKDKISIIIPTYNEKENIRKIIPEIDKNMDDYDYEILVVDDDSPDGTWKTAEKMSKEYPAVKVIRRKDERGLSSAVIKGFKMAKGDILCVIDADLSHPPSKLPEVIKPIIEGVGEMVIASRYTEGGGTEGWPAKRRMISKSATLLARFVTSVKDPMSGFIALKKEVIKGVKLNPIGYKIGLEIIARGNYKNIVEVPFIFKDRKYGESKLKGTVMREYISHLFSLLFARNSQFKTFVKFCTVGATGTMVNLAVLYTTVEFFLIHYMIGATLAFVVAVTSNYIFNKFWTFKYEAKKTIDTAYSYGVFVGVSVIGLGINLIALYFLVEFFNIWYIFAQILAIIVAMSWNFVGSKTWAFK
jgi:dolichol-phosphate mannosyltransferase